MKKAEVVQLCKKIVKDYPDWTFTANMFKNKCFKHTDLMMDPMWSLGGIQPKTMIRNKQVAKLSHQILGQAIRYTSFVSHVNSRFALKEQGIERPNMIYYQTDAQVEAVFRYHMDTCIEVVEYNYNYPDEMDLLANLPLRISGPQAVEYCIARILVGDREYIQRYYSGENARPDQIRYEDLEKIMIHFDIAIPEKTYN